MPVIIPQESGRAATVERPPMYLSSAYLDAWRILGWIGLAFIVMAGSEIVIGWYPLRFGSPEWEFGTISATMGSLSIPTLGFYLILSSAISRERRGEARIVGIGMIVMAVLLLGLAIVYLTNVPLLLKAVAVNQVASQGIKKGVLRWIILFVGYETVFILGGLKGIRRRFAA
jgi:hypothetical protein